MCTIIPDDLFSLERCMNIGEDELKAIRVIVKEGLIEYYEEIKSFYERIIIESKDYDCIVFDEIDTLDLFTLFLIIIWNEEENSKLRALIQNNWHKFMTYSSYVGSLNKRDTRPKVLVVQNGMVTGNNYSELIYKIEENTTRVIGRKIGDTNVTKKSVHLFQCENVNSPLEMVGKINPVLKFQNKEAAIMFIHKINTVITLCGKINNRFVIPVTIQKDCFKNLTEIGIMSGFNIISEDVGDFYERYYYGFAGEQNKYYCSIRAIKNQFTQEYRIIPFVFLPKLSDSSYNELKQDVFKKLGIQALSLDVQIEYELIQLYISQSLLNSWAKKSKINLSPQNYDLTKIILNFGLNEDGKIISKEIFSRLFNDEYLLSYEELVSILNNATKDSPSYDSLCSTKHSLNTHIENWMFTTIMEELLENYIRSIRYIARRGEFGENYEYGQKNNWNYSLYSIIGKILQENSAPIDEVIRDLWRLIDGRYANTSIKADATDKNYCGETLQVNFGATVLLNIKYAQYMSLLVYLCQFELKKGKSVAETLEPCLRDAKEKGLIDSETDIGLLSAQLINYLDWLKKVGSDPLEWSHIKFDSYPIITNLSNNIYHFGLKWASVDTDLKKRKLYRLSKSKYPM